MYKMKLLATTLALVIHGTASYAQNLVLEEVIVTATKRAESLQDIGVTVNAFSAETIQQAGINSASDVAILTPSLNVNSNSSPFSARLTIRGIGTSQTDPALEPSVGVFVDEVFMGRSGLGMSDLVDIERIEVLQGPQGTLYGKNTNAGAISVITRAPNMEEFEGFVEVSAGNYDMQKLTGAASGPLSDTIAYRISGSLHEHDGYYDNSGSQEDFNDADDWNLQGKLQWDVNDSTSVLLNFSHVERDQICCSGDSTQAEEVNNVLEAQGFAPDENDPFDRDVATDAPARFEMESDTASLTINYDADWGSLKSITAWNDHEYTTTIDGDGSELDLIVAGGDTFTGESISQEFRFTSQINDQVDYMLGLFYYDQTIERDGLSATFGDDILLVATQFNPLAGLLVAPGDNIAGEHEFETETLALFGQVNWQLTDALGITAGLRWNDEEKDADILTVNHSSAPGLGGIFLVDVTSTPIDEEFNRSTTNTDWLLRATYDLTPETMVFASASTGSKSGGFNGSSGAAEEREFDDETTMSYELGIKSTLLDSRLRINATLFYTEIEDYQQQVQNSQGLGTVVASVGEIETSGLDLQFEALALPNLMLSGGVLYMHDYEITEGPTEGQDLPFTAEISANLAATLFLPIGDGRGYLRADYSYMDDHLTNTVHYDQIIDSRDIQDRTLVNAKLGWTNDHWDISVWGKNLTDEDYAAQTLATNALIGRDFYYLTAPRTYGATLRYNF
jgi:iron complex outermembrane receptor protein